MQHERVVAYVRELQALMANVQKLRQGLAQTQAQAAIATEAGDTKGRTALAEQRQQIEQLLSNTETVVSRFSSRPSVASALDLLKDLEVRLEHHAELEQHYRRSSAQFELAASTGAFTDDDALRAQAEARLAQAKLEMDKQLELAGNLVPTPKVQLSLV
jgi:ATP-dependent protease HslVU (ClpYQ) peptidase subunit